MRIQVPVTEAFNFHSTVTSHGWRQLAPFAYDEDTATLSRIHQLADGTVLLLQMRAAEQAIAVDIPDADSLSDAQLAEIQQAVARIFSLHWQLDDFYAYLREQDIHLEAIERRAGRLLVAPTVWENMAKVLLTVNTRWAQTITMSERLCAFGTPYERIENAFAFPTPQHIAEMDEAEFTRLVRAGYRGAYLYQLAQHITGISSPDADLSQKIRAGYQGAILTRLKQLDDNSLPDIEAWYGGSVPPQAIYEQIRALSGYGDYAAGTMLRLLGHFEYLAIDSECRAAYKRITKKEKFRDKDIRSYYEPYGQWQGLIAWLDIMRD